MSLNPTNYIIVPNKLFCHALLRWKIKVLPMYTGTSSDLKLNNLLPPELKKVSKIDPSFQFSHEKMHVFPSF